MLHSIKHKILIYFSAAAFLTIALLSMIVTWQFNYSFSQQADQLTRNLTAHIYDNLDYPHQTFAVRLRNDIRRVADDVRQTPGLVTALKSRQSRVLLATLQRISARESLDFAALFDVDGRLQSSSPSTLNGSRIEDVFHASEFGSLPQRIRQGDTDGTDIWDSLSHIALPTLKTLGVPTSNIAPQGTIWIAAFSVIKDERDNPIGFCFIARLLNNYTAILTEMHNTGGYASVIYAGDTPIAQAGFGSLGEEAFDLSALQLPQVIRPIILQSREKTSQTMMLAGQDYLMACAPLVSYKHLKIGSICIGLPETQVSDTYRNLLAQGERTRQEILTSIMQIGLLSLAVFMLLSILIATTIVGPLQRLSHTSKQIAAGDLKQQIPITSHDEIGELIRTFNDMTANLRDKEQTVEEQTAKLSTAYDQLKGVLKKNMALLKQSNRSQQLLRNVLDNSPELIFAKDKDFRYILANARYAKRLGKTEEEIIGKDDLEIGLSKEHVFGDPGKGLHGFRSDDATALAGNPVHNPHDIIVGEDGTQRVFDTYKLPLRDDSGEVFAILGVSHDHTEQRQAEQQLRTFHALTEYSIDAICIIDLDGTFSYANQAAYELFGYEYDRQEMLGMPLRNMWVDGQNAVSFDDIVRHTKAGWWRGELVQQRKDASVFNAYLTTFLLRDDQERPMAMAALVRDITDRKKAEDQLRAVSQYTRSLLESSLDPILTISPKGVITDVNSATEFIIGVAREHLIGSDFAAYFTPPGDAVVLYKQAFLRGFIRDFPLIIRHASGQETDVLCHATVYRNAKGAVQGVFVSARDITERKRMEEEIVKFKTIADHAEYGVAISDIQGTIEYTNDYFARVHGYAAEEIIGQPLTSLHNDAQRAHVLKLLSDLHEHGLMQVEEVWHTRKDGHVFPMLMSIMLIRDDKDTPQFMAITALDITDMKLAEERLRQTNQQLQEASQHKSNFLANMSHELRTPLNAIIGFTSMTIKALKNSLPEEHLKNLKKSETAARTLMQLISDVLDLSKIEAGQMQTHIEDIYLEDLMDEVSITTEGLLLGRTITFTCDYPDELPVIRNDYIKLKQILNNLLSNAVKFTTEGGVSLTITPLHDPVPNWGIRVEVRDTGCGIPEDKLPGIFDSFKQVDGSIKKKFGGTGLGLAITKKFCGALGIDIDVWSEPDKGTTFWLSVPATYQGISGALPPEQTAQSSASDSQLFFPASEQKALILCVAPEETCSLIRRYVGPIPLEVYQVATEEECLEHAKHSLIWAMLMESGSDGVDTVAHLKDDTLFAQVPLLLYGPDDTLDTLPSSGPLEHLVSPLEESHLLHALFRITQQRTGKPATSQTILIVDDNQMNLELEASVFRSAGYTVYTAASGAEGIKLASEALPDVILMDLAMPGMDGFEATQHILRQAATADTAIIACSAFATKEYQQQAAEVGCKGYITKPIEPNRLVEQVTMYFLTTKINQQINEFHQA